MPNARNVAVQEPSVPRIRGEAHSLTYKRQ